MAAPQPASFDGLLPDSLILRSQRNAVFAAAKEQGLNPSDFEWSATSDRPAGFPDKPYAQLVHRQSGYFFTFGYDERDNTRFVACSPWDEGQIKRPAVTQGGWNGQLALARIWLGYVACEVTVADLWANVAEQQALVTEVASASQPNTPFTADEQRLIADQLRELQEFVIRTQELSGEHELVVRSRLDYLSDAARRQGR